ncbi:amidohydrolase [Acidobacteriota bacterium]
MFKKLKSFLPIILVSAALFAILNCQQKTSDVKADLILLNGNIVTMNPDLPKAEAVAIRGSRIISVGANEDVDPFIGEETKKIDLEQKLAIPGFIDAHVHPFSAGRALTVLDLKGLTKEQILDKVAHKAKETEKGAWIEGRGWDQGFWQVKKFPTRYDLDAVALDNPVALTRIDGHSGWYNSLALQLSNIDKDTQAPEGGQILRDAQGEPTGMLIDEAMGLLKRERYGEGLENREAYIKLAMEQYRKWGVTGIHDAGAGKESLQTYEELKSKGELTVRVYAMISAGSEAFPEYLNKGPLVDLENHLLTIRSVKMLIDGALGSRGALLFEPYTDSPNTSGLQLMREENVYDVIKKSLENGFQVCIHAIGDKANHMVLNLYQKALEENPVEDHRFRIEHASVIQPKDLPRFKELSVIASMQPVFIGEYGRWSEDRLGPQRVKGVLILRQLLDSGVIIAGGTDNPASDDGNPLLNFYTAIARKSPHGLPEEWYGQEKITREEALRILTLDAAYAAFEEDIKGSIETGKLADIVVLNKDIMSIDEEEILNTEVLMTILDGKIIYSK